MISQEVDQHIYPSNEREDFHKILYSLIIGCPALPVLREAVGDSSGRVENIGASLHVCMNISRNRVLTVLNTHYLVMAKDMK